MAVEVVSSCSTIFPFRLSAKFNIVSNADVVTITIQLQFFHVSPATTAAITNTVTGTWGILVVFAINCILKASIFVSGTPTV
mmetsp:Transcript_32804/g.45826  ORF Transcript_32804/g.45826 Transcript_32804/m.45826 type:complete len:82 (-) Transcript_32804:48-293(-)